MTDRNSSALGSALALTFLSFVVASHCDAHEGIQAQKKSSVSSNTPNKQAPKASARFSVGNTVFVRVNKYSPLSGGPAMQDMTGGSGYVLKNLNPRGIELVVATPASDAAKVSFGEAVTLVEKKEGDPTMWVVSRGDSKFDLPEFILTGSQSEVDLLRKTGRIPETMTLVYETPDQIIRTWGVVLEAYAVVYSHGLALLAYKSGTSPFAVRQNVVVFHESFVRRDKSLTPPPVFDSNKKALPIDSTSLYYCVSDGTKPAFERITASSR